MIGTRTRTQTHAHTYIHTHAHTLTYTYIPTCAHAAERTSRKSRKQCSSNGEHLFRAQLPHGRFDHLLWQPPAVQEGAKREPCLNPEGRRGKGRNLGAWRDPAPVRLVGQPPESPAASDVDFGCSWDVEGREEDATVRQRQGRHRHAQCLSAEVVPKAEDVC